jgi:hypothetical protein
MGTSSVRCTDFEPCSTSVIERGPLRAYSVGCAAFTPVFCLMAFLARVCSAADADGELSLSTRQAPMSGTSQPIWYLYSLNPDCSLAGMPSMEVLTAPSHGSIEVRNVESFPAHPATDPRHECNQRKSAMTGALYTPDTGFIGSDKFVMRGVFASGDSVVRQYITTIEAPRSNLTPALPNTSTAANDMPLISVVLYRPPRIDPAIPLKIGPRYYPPESLHAHEQGRCIVNVTVAGGHLIPATEDGVPIEKQIPLPMVWALTH